MEANFDGVPPPPVVFGNSVFSFLHGGGFTIHVPAGMIAHNLTMVPVGNGGNAGGDGGNAGGEGGNAGGNAGGNVGGNAGDNAVENNGINGEGIGVPEHLTGRILQHAMIGRLSQTQVIHLLHHDDTIPVRDKLVRRPMGGILGGVFLYDGECLNDRDGHNYGGTHRYFNQTLHHQGQEIHIHYRRSMAAQMNITPHNRIIVSRRYSIRIEPNQPRHRFLIHYRQEDMNTAVEDEGDPRIPVEPVFQLG